MSMKMRRRFQSIFQKYSSTHLYNGRNNTRGNIHFLEMKFQRHWQLEMDGVLFLLMLIMS